MSIFGRFSGYHDCPCRDCFDIAIGGEGEDEVPSLCHACRDAGCDPDGDCECQREDAYGAWNEEDEDDSDGDGDPGHGGAL